jgi:WD40 repeat protein
MLNMKTSLAGLLSLLVGSAALLALADEKTPVRADLQGDPLPSGAMARLGTLRWRHGSNVTFVAFVGGGKEVLSCAGDGVIHIWDASSGKEVRHFGEAVKFEQLDPRASTFRGVRPVNSWQQPGRAAHLAISEDGKTLAAGSPDGKVHLWDIASGKEMRSFAHGHPQYPVSLTFTPDGKTLVSRGGQDQKIKVWDPATGQMIREFGEQTTNGRTIYYGDTIGPIVVSPDGKLLAGGALDYDNQGILPSLRVWDLKDGKEIQKITDEGGRGIANTTTWPTFSPDGKNVAWSRIDNSIVIHEVVSGKEVRKIEAENAGHRMLRVAFSPDGKTLAACRSDQMICLLDVATGKQQKQIGESLPEVQGRAVPRVMRGRVVYYGSSAFAWAPDGKSVVQGWSNVVRLWNTETGKGNDLASGHYGEVNGVVADDDGKTALTMGLDSTLRQWDTASGRELKKLDLPTDSSGTLLLSTARALVKFADGSARLWDVDTGKELLKVEMAAGAVGVGGAMINPFRGAQGQMAVSANGRALVTTTAAQTMRIVSLENGKDLGEIKDTLSNGADPRSYRLLRSLACAPDGSSVAFMLYCQDYTSAPGGGIQTSVRNLLRLHDAETGRLIWELDSQAAQGHSLTFSPDGHNLALIDAAGNVVVLEAVTGKERCRFALPASTLAFSTDGRFLAVNTLDDAVKVIDLGSGKEIAEFHGKQGRVRCLAFGPEAGTLFAGGADGTTLLWNTREQVQQARQPGDADAETVKRLWADLAEADAARAYKAVTALSALAKPTVTWMKEQLHPARGEDQSHITKLISDLDDEEFDVRKKAFEELSNLGNQARPALKKALEGTPSAEVRKQSEELLERLAPGQVSLSGDTLREVRAIEVLETIGTPESRAILEALSRGAGGTRLTEEAAAALKRLGGPR